MNKSFFKSRVRNSMRLHALQKRLDGDVCYKGLDYRSEMGIVLVYLNSIDSNLPDEIPEAEFTGYEQRGKEYMDTEVAKLKPK